MNIQAGNPEKPVDRNSGRTAPWITLKDLTWLGYLYPARWISRVSIPVINLLLKLVEPLFQLFSSPRREYIEKKLRILFGSEMPTPCFKMIARRYVSNFVRRAGNVSYLIKEISP